MLRIMKAVLGNYSEDISQMNRQYKTRMILRRVSTGDKSAIEDCVNIYGSVIWALARKYTETAAEAENAVLEIFGDLWKYAKHFESIECVEVNFVWLIVRRRLNLNEKKF